MSEIAPLIEPLREGLAARADELGLDPGRITVEPILNWGGFINRSFRVSDGRRTLFAKLTRDPEILRGLQSWHALAPLLEARYRAPRMAGWLDLHDAGAAGPLFEWIDGGRVEVLDARFAQEIAPVVASLHADRQLAGSLQDSAGNCAQAYLESYHERFVEDLAFVGADPPPFVSHDRIAWLRDQIDALETEVRASQAFQAPADRPVHGDLWIDNLMTDRSGRWYLIDWDGLSLADTVTDWVMLFGPSRARPSAANEELVVSHATLTREERERLPIYIRASQLDWILDPLADWVQGAREPEHGEAIRIVNERTHRAALAEYLKRFGR